VAATEDLPIHCRHQSVWLASHPGPLASTQLSLGAPAVHAANGRLTQGASFQIAELVEQEQGVIAGTAEVTIVGRAFLIAVVRADAAIRDLSRGSEVVPLIRTVWQLRTVWQRN